MLILSRRVNESILIGDDVTVMITGFVGDTVKVGIIAPREVRVDRLEVKAAREHGARKGEPRDRV